MAATGTTQTTCRYCKAEVRGDWRELWDYADMRARMTWVLALHSIPASGEKCPQSEQEVFGVNY